MIDQSQGGRPPVVGVVEWLRPGEHDRVERVLADVGRLNVDHLRTGFSWADYHTAAGKEWYDWLMPRLAREVDVLPCFTYTPPSLGVEPKTSSPPRRPRDYADFIDTIITRFGDHFEWVELWNEPNNLKDWDWRMDPGWGVFCEMIAAAANWSRERGKKTVLGGMCPTDPGWLDILAANGVLEHIDAVGVHGFPGTWEFDWADWSTPISSVREVLERHGLSPELWITEAGYSTSKHDEFAQLEAFVDLLDARADRIYWYSAHDLDPSVPHQDGFHADERHYHFGLFRHDGRPKLLGRLWSDEGLPAVRRIARLGEANGAELRRETNGQAGGSTNSPSGRSTNGQIGGRTNGPSGGRTNGASTNGHEPGSLSPFRDVAIRTNGELKRGYTLITGGAGFIGTNLAHRLLESGRRVRILDSLARPGVERNLEWLCENYGEQIELQLEDVRNPWAVYEAVLKADQVFHFAAQVAVTSSVESPRDDFDVNARGTLNVLEALRKLDSPPPLLFTSTNKVYGDLDDLRLELNGRAYTQADGRYPDGIGPDRPLDFESPYGCSKGAADQYVLDYCRMYNLPTIVFRMSCIYGPHQFGTEDQGWVAHFLLRTLRDEPITIYGDGCQVRDVLFVDDLVRAMLMSMNEIGSVRGRAFNVGGGAERAVSLVQVLDLIKKIHGGLPEVNFADWRPSDQRYYVSDTRELERATGWRPEVGVAEGLRRLYDWMLEESSMELPEPIS